MSLTDTPTWVAWAVLSACFAALTAIFAKIGLEGIDSDFATLIRTVVILIVLTGFVAYAGKWSNPMELRSKTLLFLVLSGLATGASWVCYFRALKMGDASKVAPIDKLSGSRPGSHAKSRAIARARASRASQWCAVRRWRRRATAPFGDGYVSCAQASSPAR